MICPTILLKPLPVVEASTILDIRFCNAPLVVPLFCNTFGMICVSEEAVAINAWLLHRPNPDLVTAAAVTYFTERSLSRVSDNPRDGARFF